MGSGYEPALDGVGASASFSWGFAGRGMLARLQRPCNGVCHPLQGQGRAVPAATRRLGVHLGAQHPPRSWGSLSKRARGQEWVPSAGAPRKEGARRVC